MRYEKCLGIVLAMIISFGTAMAADMTVEDAKTLPGVVAVTQYDGSVAYYRNYDDYNANNPVAVEKPAQTTMTNITPNATTVSQAASAASSSKHYMEMSDEELIRSYGQTNGGAQLGHNNEGYSREERVQAIREGARAARGGRGHPSVFSRLRGR